jgi:hypothetical protein
MKTIYSILPELKNQMGHFFEYALSVKRAAEMNGWRHACWAPSDCEIDPMPENWKKNLIPGLGFSKILRHFFAYRSAIRKLPDPSNAVLFLEHFRFTNLFALFFALLFNRRPSELWLLYRYAPSQMSRNGIPHVYLLKIFALLFGKNRLRLLTDSILLQRQQETFFKRVVDLIPIPHGKMSTPEKFPKIEGVIDCWWPGGSTREEKGLPQIRALSEQLGKGTFPIRLIVAENAASKGIKATLFVESNMTRSNYKKWFNTTDIALLPYDPAVYHSGTSGIFVEAVLAGAIPVVREGTWMAHELKRYGLDEFILDWEDPALPNRLLILAKNEKLEKIRLDYHKFHSLEGFAEALFKRS